jgi:hypothetical protein
MYVKKMVIVLVKILKIVKNTKRRKTMKYKQKCAVCGYETIWFPKNEEELDIIKASCLPCGHQGCFILEEIKDE